MKHSILLYVLGVVAVSIAVVPAASGTGDSGRYVASAAVKIKSSGFDFGSSGFLFGAPTGSGALDWWTVDGAPSPELNGTLHLDGVTGACARMQLDYLTSAGLSLATREGSQRCVHDDKHHAFTISLSTFSSSKIAKVKVTLQRLFATGGWKSVGSQTVNFGPYDDKVKITEDGIDFGNGTFIGSGPTGSGQLRWTYDQAAVHGHLTGTLHLNKLAGVCGRVKVDFRDAGGTVIGSDTGGSACATDNQHHKFTVDLSSFSSRDIVDAKVRVQTLGSDGVWRDAGTTAVTFSAKSKIVLAGG